MVEKKETAEIMRVIAQGLDDVLNGQQRPKHNGFVLLVFPFDMPVGARTNYVSNADRKDIIVALKEIVARFEGQAEVSGRA
jgi:hypothetical protein